MHHVLIVDDERLIREGLRSLIDWEAHGFQVVAVVADGREALDWSQTHVADLIIADIRMPRMDGLELLTELRKTGRTTKFLVLSGFAEFEYAQKAAALGIVGYLLKPVDEAELIGHLASVRQQLEGAVTGWQLVHRREAFPASWNWGRWQVLLFTLVSTTGQSVPLSKEAETRLRRVVHEHAWGEVLFDPSLCGLLLRHVYPQGRNVGSLARELAPLLEHGAIFVGSVGDVVTTAAEVETSFRQAERRLAHRFFQSPSSINSADREPTAAPDPAQRHKDAEKLALVLEAGRADQLKPVVTELAERLAGPLDEALVKDGLASLVVNAIEGYQRSPARASSRPSRDTSWLAEVWKLPFLSQLVDYLTHHLEQVLTDDQGPDGGPLVPRMLEILETRYAENLKLETLASVFQYNGAYLGKLFRRETGEYFNNALDKVRIRHAQRLLREGLKVYQVAELVGYKYVDYFHAKFKKYTGLSPSQYRDTEGPSP